MRATEIEGVELAAYRMKGVAYSWFELWEDSREEGSSPARWNEFADAFIDHFLHVETSATHAAEFENLKQGCTSLFKGLNTLTINEVSTAALNSDMNYGKMVAFAQATKNHKLKNIMERERCTTIRAQLASVESFQARSGQQGIPSAGSVRREVPAAADVPVPQVRGQSGERFQQQQRSPCPRCEKMHSGTYYLELPICYGYGMMGHI
uniref:Uncharacterized protein LOC104221893 n=1 Tax=Nicotiana sylvestris TaxID=4096 RepID=A0A1U7VY94_NICSY|nr:PREDICTED: uncharacterized protein LOC104221893 [Nicotiana sylvestris]